MVELTLFIAGIVLGYGFHVIQVHPVLRHHGAGHRFWQEKYEELFNDYESVCSQYADLDERYVQLKRRTEDEEA